MKTYKLIPIGVRSADGRLIAIDADLRLPDVFPVRTDDGYGMSLDGYGERPRIENGYLVADFTLKGAAAELMARGDHFLSPSFTDFDHEIFEETETAVMIKGELRGVVVMSNEFNPWGQA